MIFVNIVTYKNSRISENKVPVGVLKHCAFIVYSVSSFVCCKVDVDWFSFWHSIRDTMTPLSLDNGVPIAKRKNELILVFRTPYRPC